MRNTAPKDAAEIEALETREWLESLDYVLQSGGPARVSRLPRGLGGRAPPHGGSRPPPGAVRATPPPGPPPPVPRKHPVHQQHPPTGPAAVPGQPRDRAPHQEP